MIENRLRNTRQIGMKNFSYEKVQFHMEQAIENAPFETFREMAKKVHEAIHYEGRYLTEQQREDLRKQYHYYLDNVMFARDVEFVCIDTKGKLYNSSQDVPRNVFYWEGYRWKRTGKMLYKCYWIMYDGDSFTSIKEEEFRAGFYQSK